MNLQYADLHLAAVSPPAPISRKTDEQDMPQDMPKAVNDNQIVWPLVPFPEDWCVLN